MPVDMGNSKPDTLNHAEVNGLLTAVDLPFYLPVSVYGAMLAIWHTRPFLQKRFPLHKCRSNDYIRFLVWCATIGKKRYAILRSLPDENVSFGLFFRNVFIQKIFYLVGYLRSRPSESQIATITNQISVYKEPSLHMDYPFGVNLFGYAQGEIGIGEDVRLVALALESQGIPFCVLNVSPGENVSQKDESVNHWIVDEPCYAINIFCVTGAETVRHICEHGVDVLEGRYSIGFWPWELPDWPESCRHAYSTVDEIWGISRYTANAYRGAPCSTHVMSLPVTIDNISSLGRSDFGLPVDDYLFVFSFDFNSTLLRKNPEAVIRSFQHAFSVSGKQAVGLVIKVSHAESGDSKWKRIQRIIRGDSRIHLINETLRKPDVLALYKCCDCYVSLHRAEGFGRGLAEALLLDLQVITTDFSGNLDFCNKERVGLVRYSLKVVRPLEYFHGDGQSWADPDIEHAVQLMQEIYAKPKSIKPEELLDFSPNALGIRYARRLREIEQKVTFQSDKKIKQQ